MACWTRPLLKPAKLAAFLPFLFAATPAFASEGGSSIYLQGTYNDYAVAVLGPQGVYLRSDLAYYTADVGARPLGGRVQAGIDEELFIDVVKLIYLSDTEFLGGRIGTAATLPVIPYVDASLHIDAGPVNGFIAGDRGGIGDLYLNPILIGWTEGKLHVLFAPGVAIPTGAYDADRAINLGRNYWAIDPVVSVTYLDPAAGIDLSMSAGIMFNFENAATDYETGNELHIDFNLAKMLSQRFGIGLTGYYYDQLSDDSGNLPPLATDGFQGKGAGIGPSFVVNTTLGGQPLTVIGKAIFDIDSKNRFNGDIFMISLATKI